jgi:hypothetical protein
MDMNRHLNRSGLFLVRVWTVDANGEPGKRLFRGRVQRVVDGKSQRFDDLQTLGSVVLAMLSNGPDGQSDDDKAEHRNTGG